MEAEAEAGVLRLRARALRVCFLTHYFPPEVGAPQTRIDLLARTLAAGGADVTVHTCFPHYPSGEIAAPYGNRPWQVERRDGLRIVRSAVYPAANQGFVRRLLDHSSFALSALATAPFSGPFDVVVGETPPLFTAASGAVYAALKRAAYVVNVADRWPASAVELGMLRDPRAIAAAEALERWVYRRSDLIVAPTEGIVRELGRLPDAAGKARRTWPVVDIDRFDLTEPPAADPQAPLRLLYAGTIGLAQGLATLVEASRLAGPELVETTIAGGGAEADGIRALLRERRIENVELLGTVVAALVPGLFARSDACAVLLKDLPIFAGALPTKLLEAMGAGRALLLSARGEAAELVRAAGAGIVVAPEDPRALAEAIRRLHSEPPLRRALGAAGREYAEAHFGADRAAAEWATQLRYALTARQARRGTRAGAGRRRAG